MSTHPTNADRAAWAARALATFTKLTYGGEYPSGMHPTDLSCAIADLIADLLHLAHSQGFDVSSIVTNARSHFECEEHEEE